ncbi:cupin domain-containing protein [Enterobacteriaceae bacterium H16N7]|nr:cupin domain-containing protein [Dryocola clanedunensis]
MNDQLISKLLQIMSIALASKDTVTHTRAQYQDCTEKLLLQVVPNFLSGINHIYEDIKLLRGGNVSRISEEYCKDGNVSQYVSALLLSRGTTIVYNHLEKRSSFFYNFFVKALRQNKIVTHFNCYWSPAGSSGAGKHADIHDVLVVQLAGSKCWKFEGRNIDLRAGDILFVRKGTLHDPVSPEGSDSLHLTIGMVTEPESCPAFPEPVFMCEPWQQRHALQFVKSMNVLSTTLLPAIHLDEKVHVVEDTEKIFFLYRKNELSLAKILYMAVFTQQSVGRLLYFRSEVDRQSIINFILTIYKSGIPFCLEK